MSPFEVLGIAPDADDAALKRAYFRKVREHPPETDPERFQDVQRAFETLRDPMRRREAQLPDRLRELLASIDRITEAKVAAAQLLTAVGEFPDVPALRVRLAQQLHRAGNRDHAVESMRAAAARFPSDVDVWLTLAQIEKGPARREALKRAMGLAPLDRRPLYLDARELLDAKEWAAAQAALDQALALDDRRWVSDTELFGARVLTRLERGDTAAVNRELAQASPEQAPALVSLAAAMISTDRLPQARALLDQVRVLQPEREPVPFGPSRHIPLARLPHATRAAVALNASEPSRRTVKIARVMPTKKWVAKPVWWVELRPLHLIVRRSSGVQVSPLLSLKLQQREADVPLMLCDGHDAGLDGLPELAFLFEVAIERRSRLLALMSKDLLETEYALEPLQWTLSSNA